MSSDELFYLDANNKKQDIDLHIEILGADLDGVVHSSAIAAAKAAGLTDQDMKALGLKKQD